MSKKSRNRKKFAVRMLCIIMAFLMFAGLLASLIYTLIYIL